MNRILKCNRCHIYAAMAVMGLALCGVALAQAARTVWTAKPEVRLLNAKSSRANTLAVLPKGVEMQVLAEEGAWYKVQITDKDGKTHTGYTFKGNLSDKKVDGDNLAATFGTGGGQTSGLDTGLAGKGVDQEVKTLADGKNWDVNAADRMIAVSASVTAQQLEQFDKEGHVGVGAK